MHACKQQHFLPLPSFRFLFNLIGIPARPTSATSLSLSPPSRIIHVQQRSHATSSVVSKLADFSSSSGKRKGYRKAVYFFIFVFVAIPCAKIAWSLWPLYSSSSSGKIRRSVFPAHVSLLGSSASMSRTWQINEAIDRLVRDLFVAAMIISDYVYHRESLDWSAIHQRGADRLLNLFRVNGGVYIKLGQHLGQLEYLLPSPYVQTMKELMHDTPQDDWPLVEAVLLAELCGSIGDSSGPHTLEDIFSSLDRVPLASASLAQVHRGTLRSTGAPVAVKIQHIGLLETSAADIATVSAIVRTVKALFPRFDYMWLAEELEANLPHELDFLHEAQNCRTMGALFSHRADIVVPHVYAALTTPRVLTMSFEEGSYVTDGAAIERMGLRKRDVARLVSEAFAEQIFVQGRVHADPHYANLLVRCKKGGEGEAGWGWSWWYGNAAPTPQLVLLDHGLVRSLPAQLRSDYGRLWRAIIFRDEASIKEYSSRMGAGEDLYRLWTAMLTTLSWDRIVDTNRGTNLHRSAMAESDKAQTKEYAKQYAAEIGDILRLLPRELLLILKTNDCLRSIDEGLGSPVNSYEIFARYIQRAINQHDRDAHPSSPFLTNIFCYANTLALETRLAIFAFFVWMRGGEDVTYHHHVRTQGWDCPNRGAANSRAWRDD